MVIANILTKLNKGVWLTAAVHVMNVKTRAKPVPVSNKTDGGVITISKQNTFQKVVIDSGREACILFFSKTCPHCNTILPIYEEFGDKLKDEDLDVVKIDVSENAHNPADYKVEHVPVIYWKFAAAYRKPLKYSGEINVNELIQFAAGKTVNELNGYDRKGRPK